MLDLELGRFLIFRKGFYIQPHIGLKGGWINQIQHIFYDDFQGKNLTFVSSHAKVLRKNDFTAIGPRIGLNGRWGREVAIFGNISTALLYGHFDINMKYKFNADPFLQDGAIFNNQNRLRPTLQMLLGLDWTHRFKQGYKFSVKTAYETQYWWNQWQNMSNTIGIVLEGGNLSSGDLLFHGLSIEGALSF